MTNNDSKRGIRTVAIVGESENPEIADNVREFSELHEQLSVLSKEVYRIGEIIGKTMRAIAPAVNIPEDWTGNEKVDTSFSVSSEDAM